ncbi:YceI family protein [Aridibaculum aurantiacum]|uniref:YceI family protein n=1 Tax=Aridibaculum aurantiacum TaxID=2810307 RepID=UPI001A96B099|nr:YceI family protein [Aridibaculum aurantiacum]
MKQTIFSLFSAIVLLTSCKKETEKINDYTVNTTESKVEWKGYLADGYFNRGTFSIASAEIKTRNNKVEGGRFTIPILSLDVLNLTGEPKAGLEAHLKSPDFFNILVHPNAYFDISQIVPYHKQNEAGVIQGANFQVTGGFKMLGVTKTISFPARITFTGNKLQVEATFKINRVDWGMTYAADPAAGAHHIKPVVDLHLKLSADKK